MAIYWYSFATKQAAKLFLTRLRETDTETQFDLRPEGAGWLGRVSTERPLPRALKVRGQPWGRLLKEPPRARPRR